MASMPMQPQFIASTGNRSLSNAPLIENPESDQIVVPDVSKIFLWMSFGLRVYPGFRMFALTSLIRSVVLDEDDLFVF